MILHPADHVANVYHPRANLAYEFSPSRIRPFVLGGAGAARIRQIQTIAFPTAGETRDETETTFAVHFGGGVAIHAGRIVLRPQFVVIPADASQTISISFMLPFSSLSDCKDSISMLIHSRRLFRKLALTMIYVAQLI